MNDLFSNKAVRSEFLALLGPKIYQILNYNTE